MKSYYLGLLLLFQFYAFTAQSDQVDNYRALSKAYGQSYMEYLKLSSSAPRQTKILEEAIQKKQVQLSAKNEELNQLTSDLQETESVLKSLKMNREFLIRSIELAKEKQEQTKSNARQSAEYKPGEEVNIASLEFKASQLQIEINGIQDQIDVLNASIKSIEDSDPYRQRVNAVSSAHSRLRQIESNISSLESSIRNLQGMVRDGEYEVSRLEREVDNAQDRLDDIRRTIPRLESEIRRLEWDAQDVGRRLQRNKSQRQNVRQRISHLKSKKSGLDPVKDADRIRQIDSEISREESRLRSLRQEHSQLENRERQIRFEISRLRGDVRDLEWEQRRLDSDIDSMERRLSSVQRELASNRSSLRSKEIELDSARSQRDRQVEVLRRARQELADYRQTHIGPLEDQVRGFKSQISGLEQRKTQLLTWKEQLIRQDQNIQKAKADIEASQENEKQITSTIESLQVQIRTANQELHKLSSELSQAQVNLDNYLEEVRQKRARTLELEAQMEALKDEIIGTEHGIEIGQGGQK